MRQNIGQSKKQCPLNDCGWNKNIEMNVQEIIQDRIRKDIVMVTIDASTEDNKREIIWDDWGYTIEIDGYQG